MIIWQASIASTTSFRADLMHQRQRQICRRRVDRLVGFGVQAIQKLNEQSLSDDFIGRRERAKERDAKSLQAHRFIQDRLDDLPSLGFRNPDARCWQRRRHKFAVGSSRALQVAQHQGALVQGRHVSLLAWWTEHRPG